MSAKNTKKKEIIEEVMVESDVKVIEEKKNKKVKVIVPALNIRERPDMKSSIVGCIRDGGEYELSEESKGWGKLVNGAGWIMLKFCKVVS